MDFPKLLVMLVLLPFLTNESYVGAASDDEDFFKKCSSQRCSKHGPKIQFPFRLSTQPTSCGADGMQLSCSGHDTIFDHPVLGSCKVTAIYYMHRVINITPPVEPLAQCPLQKLILKKLETGVYKQPQSFTTMVRCSKSFIPAYPYSIVGPAPCVSSNTSQFWYLALASAYISDLPWDCVAISKGIPIPFSYDKHGPNSDPSNEIAKAVVNFGATTFTWHLNNITGVCQQCEHEGRYCGFSSQKRQAFCQHHGTHAISIAEASSVAAFAVLSMMVVTVIFLSLKSRPFWVVVVAACFPGKGLHSRLNPLVNEFDQIISISAFKDVHSNTVIFGIHTSTVVDQTQLDCAKSSVKPAISANLESKASTTEDMGRQVLAFVERYNI
ncbi:hypothetical protein ZWY2020_031288 [Hordeum vulgare]|nr:hypothetical protein ZWY2020_031288 [Hordeum vulgare]